VGEAKAEVLTKIQIVSGGRNRSMAVWRPRGHAFNASYGLLFVLHGGRGSPEQVFVTGDFQKFGSAYDFLLVFPEGEGGSWADGRGATEADKKGINDVQFISDAIDVLVSARAVDPKRVLATGISNGGMMSFRLGCELPNKIRGIAPIAAALPTNLEGKCNAASTAKVLLMHGSEDPIIPSAGGTVSKGEGGEILSTEATVKQWVSLLGCNSLGPSVAKDAVPIDETRLEIQDAVGCRTAAALRFVNIVGGGHTWPGGSGAKLPRLLGATSQELNATEAVFDHFSTKE
jgi:polyhydroxybutyrate depolymerase